MNKRNSTVKSIRISMELKDFLEQDAEEQSLTFNALVSKILMRHIQWEKFHDKFGFVTMTSEFFEGILSHCNNETLENIGRELGARMTSQLAMFWQKNVSFQGFLQTWALISRHSGLYNLEAKEDGSMMVLTFHHDHGVKWSILLRSFVESSLNNVLDKTKISVEYTGNSVFARVKLPIYTDR